MTTATAAASGLSLVGHAVFDPEGTELGEVAGVYLDNASGQPEWAALRRADGGISVVPLARAAIYEDSIDVSFTRQQVEGAPYRRTTLARQLSEAQEAKLYRHYGRGDAEPGGPATASTEMAPAANEQGPPVAPTGADQTQGVASTAKDGDSEMAEEVSARTRNLFERLGNVPEGLLGFARRRPGLFLLATAAAGFAAGRALRSARAKDDEDPQQNDGTWRQLDPQLDPAALDALSAQLWADDVDERRSLEDAAERAAAAGRRRRRATTAGGG